MDKYKYLVLVFIMCAVTIVKAQGDETAAKNSLFYYSGYLGKSDKVEFNLQLTKLKVSGSYILEESGALFIFNGRMATDKSGLGVLIYTESNEYVASMEAKFISDENNFAKEIKGIWRGADGQSTLPIALKKVAELAYSSDRIPVNLSD
ncbi:MAG: hypothetical protein AAF149_19665 [Bacteroidota bacterium]|mgnify:FL=1